MKRDSCLPKWAELVIVAIKVTVLLLVLAVLGGLARDAIVHSAVPQAIETPRPVDLQLDRIDRKLDQLVALQANPE